MWTREELKMSAKNVFRQNYWRCVLAGVVSVLALGSVGYQVQAAVLKTVVLII